MKTERWRQVDALFAQALEREPEERARFLDTACATDASLRREVEEMLRFDARAADFIEAPVFADAAALIGARPAGPFSSASIDESRFIPGDVLAGRYRVAGLLGRGGMGEVFRADDLKLKQPVALKFLPEAFSTDGAALARFYQEVSVARQVSHRHVCRVYDVGEAEGAHFISMEYVRGESLSSLLKRIGRLPEDKAVETARQLCAGLAAVHEAGVLHRDLKPANIMLDERGDVRITDFGIAALASGGHAAEALAGTPAYMSPEQLTGRALTTRSDLYSLGLVLYELFTGRRAFEASSLPELLRLRRSDTQPSSPSSHVKDLDPAVERVIFRCLERDPERRPANALQVAAALPGGDPLAAALAAGETPSPEMVAAAPKQGSLRPAVAVSLLAAVGASLALTFLLAGTMLHIHRYPFEKPPEVLAERARTIIRAAGQAGAPADTAYGFRMDDEFYRYVVAHDQSMTRWERLKTGQPALLYFWYRQSPQPLAPETAPEITLNDPYPQLYSGMADVRLDTEGRLVELRAVPPEVDEPGAPAAEPDWRPLFAEAGLDPAKLTPTEPRWTPPTYADRRAAWEGVFPLSAGTPLRVEAASYHGRPVSFRLIGPWDNSYRVQPYTTDPALKRVLIFLFVTSVTLLLAGAWLGRRNFRLGRGDRRGAAKLALFVFATNLAANLVGASHVPAFMGEVWLLYMIVKRALFNAAVVWLLYIALEPYVRRRSPHRLIAWTRLVVGDWRDPLVGRDVLVGALLGICMNLMTWVAEAAVRWAGIAPELKRFQFDTLLGVRGIAPWFLGMQPATSLLHGLGFVFILFLLSALLRSERRAAFGALALMVGALSLQGVHLFALPFHCLLAAGYIFVVVRFGMLAITVAQFVFFMVEFYPYTTDPSDWYSGVTLFAAAVIVALAFYGFRTSLGGRSLFRGRLLED